MNDSALQQHIRVSELTVDDLTARLRAQNAGARAMRLELERRELVRHAGICPGCLREMVRREYRAINVWHCRPCGFTRQWRAKE